MLIYILHSDRIHTFRLPKTVSGSYVLTDYDLDGHIRSLVNIQAIDGKWFINSNSNAIVNYNGNQVNQAQLIEYSFYGITLFKKENILLYIYPGNEKNYVVRELESDALLTLGNDSACDLIFISNSITAKQLEIKYEKGVWSYKNLNSKVPMYLNKRLKNESIINDFDQLFIMGLRLMFIKNKIIAISLSQKLSFSSKILQEKRQYNLSNITVEENVKDFYDKKDYFSKSPVFIKKYDEYNVIITSPESKQKGEGLSAISQIVPSALMSVTSLITTYYTVNNYRSGKTSKEDYVTNLLMCVIMLITGIVWPIIEVIGSKIRTLISGRIRVFNYRKYLKRKRKELDKVILEEKTTLNFNNLSLSACQDTILKKQAYLFSKNIDSPTFLTLKFGTGNIRSSIRFDYQRPDLIVEDDKLLNEIDKLIEDYKYISDVPFTISLKEYNSLALLNPIQNYEKYLKALILQLITLHDYKNLKLVVLTTENSELSKIKNLNHCWSDDRSFRFYASDINEAESVSSELVRIFNKRYNKNDPSIATEPITTHYLIITDAVEQYKGLKIIENIIHSKENLGFSALMFSSKIVNIPIGCSAFIEYDDNKATFFKSEMDERTNVKFTPEFIDNSVDFNLCIEKLSNIPIQLENESKGSLPDKLGFLEMYNVGKLEQLNLINKWKNSQIVNSLAAPIGVDSNNNILSLDLHEKKHGPHGLIAGMTGSGKSEFIVTYILSLAINYSPDEVQFVLIDYKGGGLAGAFENRKTGVKLPHLVGTITNLDKAEMNRTLVSIKSELQRRQRKFNEAKEILNTGSIDIYKYQSLVREGSLKESMSHLFIVCDEFAELKAQQPDFMDELVSAARIGRSLGIHLILATQKPSGVVDDQIWSNAKFKVCCKVQTSEDSNEMIRKPDAAFLKESGRFYLQVGYDEYFVLGQSGYSGVQYMPSETVVSKIDDSVSFVDNIGDIYKTAIKKDDVEVASVKKYGEELNNILKYIVDTAKANGYQYHQLWLENVPKLLMYDTLKNKYSDTKIEPYNINPLIGEYDNPKAQSQGKVTLPITTGGNSIIIGSTGMGKTTLLSTIIYSTIINHSNKEVNFYIIDMGTEKLRKYSKAPQVGDFLGANDKQRITYLFYMLESEIAKRQQYYSDNGGEFLLDVKNGKSIFPNIIVILHGIETFKETFDMLHDEKLGPITRNCSKYGINFIITATTASAISYTIDNNFRQHIALNMLDTSEYSTYFKEPIIPSKNPGRGLVEIDSECLEFQSSLIFPEEKEKEFLDYVISILNKSFPEKAKSVPTVPKHVSFERVRPLITNMKNVPIGVNEITAQDGYFDFSGRISLLASSEKDKLKKFIGKFLSILALCKDNKIIVLNTISDLEIPTDNNIKCYNSNFKQIFPILKTNIEKYNGMSSTETYSIVVLGYSKLNSHMKSEQTNDNTISTLDDLILMSTNNNFKFILYDDNNSFSKIINGNLSEIVDNENGIWIGSNYDEQESFEIERIYMDSQLSNDTVVLIKDSTPEFIKFPTVK